MKSHGNAANPSALSGNRQFQSGRNDDPAMWQRMRASYTAATTYNHTRDELRSFFAGLPLVPPGLVLASAWCGGLAEVPERLPGSAYVLAGVAVKP